MIKCVLAGVQMSEKTLNNLMAFIENEKAKAFEEGKKSVSNKRGRPRKERTPEELELIEMRNKLREQGLIKRGWVKGKPRKQRTQEELDAIKAKDEMKKNGLLKRGWIKGKPRKDWTQEEIVKRAKESEMRDRRRALVEEGVISKTGWPTGRPRGTKAEREQAKNLGITIEELRKRSA